MQLSASPVVTASWVSKSAADLGVGGLFVLGVLESNL